MTSLILTVISIVLLSAMVLITINYLPSWSKEKVEMTPVIREGALRLEKAYNLYAAAHNDAAPGPIAGDMDGGISGQLSSYLPFVPPAIPGYRWVFGATDASAPAGYQNTAYFCLTPIQSGLQVTEGKVRAALAAQESLSPEQAFVSPACGSPSNSAYNAFPATMRFTYFVRHVPGQ